MRNLTRQGLGFYCECERKREWEIKREGDREIERERVKMRKRARGKMRVLLSVSNFIHLFRTIISKVLKVTSCIFQTLNVRSWKGGQKFNYRWSAGGTVLCDNAIMRCFCFLLFIPQALYPFSVALCCCPWSCGPLVGLRWFILYLLFKSWVAV